MTACQVTVSTDSVCCSEESGVASLPLRQIVRPSLLAMEVLEEVVQYQPTSQLVGLLVGCHIATPEGHRFLAHWLLSTQTGPRRLAQAFLL